MHKDTTEMRAVVLMLLGFMSAAVHADEQAMQRFNHLSADPELRAQAYSDAQERIRFCVHCHGVDGNSTRERIPNLASQNPVYLFNSFEKFASGERTDYVMSELAKVLTLEDRVNIAIYFEQQKVKAHEGTVDPQLHARGQELFAQTCVACHGSYAQGKEDMPRLAGQPATYVSKALTRFRDKDPSRAGSVMMAVAQNLSDNDINALAAYLQSLQVPK